MKNEFKEDKNLEEMIDLVEKDNSLLETCSLELLNTISSYLDAKKKHLEDKMGD